ncbi:tRNA 2'-phosphotransferase [Diplodia intermedia]|uniref:tRNA 2'-phosphotransferase n=1 Tax=Diplodia intermedia TaxID=856260 RepID=A0ABR3T9H9_9PEZI
MPSKRQAAAASATSATTTTTTTNKAAADPPPPPPPSDVTADDAAVRKRKQNRLSQQCLREKRSAGVANQSFFERLAADIRRLREVCEKQQQQQQEGVRRGPDRDVGSGDVDGQQHEVDVVAELVRINEGLIEENRCLREAVLRMRKKLLSLSGQASAAAEDPVFQKLLGKESEAADAAPNKRRKCSSSAGSGSASGRAVGSVSSDADDQPDRVEPIRIDEGEIFANLQGEPSGSFNPLSSGSFDQRLVVPTTSGSHQPHSLHVFPPPQHTTAAEMCSDFTATAGGPNQDFHAAPNFSFTNLPQISLTNTAILDAWVSRSYANSIAQKIENVCVQYALKSRACRLDVGAGLKPGPVFHQFDERAMVERLADIAVHMIFDDTGLGRFINTLEGARDFLRSVLTCRIMLGCAKPHDLADDLDAVDADAAPWMTAATMMGSTRPLIVDLIAWPSLRDQMVFHSSFYDLDEMTEDVVNYTVVDLPGQNLALQMYSTPPNPFPTACRPPSSAGGYDGVRPYRFSEQEFTHKVLQVPNRDLLDIVARRMEAPPPAACGGPAGGGGGGGGCGGGGGAGGCPAGHVHSDLLGSVVGVECMPAKTETTRRFKGYKLSGAFFKKYPFLQCSSLSSPYPILPSSKVPTY